MSARIAMSSKLPGDPEINGLDDLHESLVDNPAQVVVALVWLDVPKITIDTEADATYRERPTVRIRKIEPIDVADKVPDEIIALYTSLQEKRTGKTPLPFLQLERSGLTDAGYGTSHASDSADDVEIEGL